MLNWGSTAVQLPTLDSRIIFTIFKLSEKVHAPEDPSLQVVYKVFKWSLHALSTGMFPWKDHNDEPFSENYFPDRFAKRGQRLAGGYCGALTEIRGDWKWIRETFYLEQHYGANYICHLCRAHTSISRLLYKDFRTTAHHRNTLVNSIAWWTAYTAGALVSPLVYIPGFDIWRLVFDLMHVLDLGVMQDCAASVMWTLTEAPEDGGIYAGHDRRSRFDAAYCDYVDWTRRQRLPSKARRFRQHQWCKGTDYPTISQQVMKAAQLRSFQYYLLEAVLRPAAMTTEPGCMRAAMMREFVAADALGQFKTSTS